jgi:hypothetical protein
MDNLQSAIEQKTEEKKEKPQEKKEKPQEKIDEPTEAESFISDLSKRFAPSEYQDYRLEYDGFCIIYADGNLSMGLDKGVFKITKEDQFTCLQRIKDKKRLYLDENGRLFECLRKQTLEEQQKEEQQKQEKEEKGFRKWHVRTLGDEKEIVMSLPKKIEPREDLKGPEEKVLKYLYRDFTIVYEDEKPNFYLNKEAFNFLSKIGDYLICQRKKDGKVFYLHISGPKSHDYFYEHLDKLDNSTEEISFFVRRIPTDEICMMLGEDTDKVSVYDIKVTIKCTNDDTCKHCSGCEQCSKLHCQDH